MGVDNYTTVSKTDIEDLINSAVKVDYFASAPIEHYSLEEIKRLSELARENKLVLSIREERSNFYQGILIQLIKRTSLSKDCFVSHL